VHRWLTTPAPARPLGGWQVGHTPHSLAGPFFDRMREIDEAMEREGARDGVQVVALRPREPFVLHIPKKGAPKFAPIPKPPSR